MNTKKEKTHDDVRIKKKCLRSVSTRSDVYPCRVKRRLDQNRTLACVTSESGTRQKKRTIAAARYQQTGGSRHTWPAIVTRQCTCQGGGAGDSSPDWGGGSRHTWPALVTRQCTCQGGGRRLPGLGRAYGAVQIACKVGRRGGGPEIFPRTISEPIKVDNKINLKPRPH